MRKGMESIQQDLQNNHPNLGTKQICHSTLLEIEITCDVSGNNLLKCAALGESNAHTKRYIPDSVDSEMMDYYDPDERERKQMHYNSSGPVRIYKAGPDESDKSGGSSGGDGSSGGGGDGWRQRIWGL